MTASPRELRRLRTFYVGEPSSSDLRDAFVIDGRDYTDPDQVRADVGAAVGELHRRQLAAQFFTEPVDGDSPRPDLPTWQDWARRHPREVPDPPGGSPATTTTPTPCRHRPDIHEKAHDPQITAPGPDIRTTAGDAGMRVADVAEVEEKRG